MVPELSERVYDVADFLTFSRRSVLALPLPLVLGACQRGPSVFSLSGQTMGTTYSVVAVDGSRSLTEADLARAIEGALAVVNASMSNWDPASEISRFNVGPAGAPIAISQPLAEVMAAAEAVNRASDGRFDTTMGPLIELWGFGQAGAAPLPSDAAIAAVAETTGHDRVLSLSGETLAKSRSEAQVYLAAIGKGYGADHVGRALAGLGLSDFMIEIGGDLYASGRNPDGVPWQIGVETPSTSIGGVHDVVALSGMGLASSGDYRNYFEEDGVRYSHVIDPMTGRPITHRTGSATVIAENAMLADAWATAMLTLGRDRGLEIAESEQIAVYFIDRDGEGGFTTASSSRYQELIA